MKQQQNPPLLLVLPQVRPMLAPYAPPVRARPERAVVERDSGEPQVSIVGTVG